MPPRPPRLFLADGLWRDLLAFTWTIQTMAGRPAIEAALRETLARTQPANFRIPPKRTPPRWVTRAGTQCLEAIFEFTTAFGPGNGILRLVPDRQGRLRAWTLNTNLHELRGHEEEFKRRAEPDSTRDFGAENWSDRLARQRAFADRDPAVLVVGGGQAGLSIAARLQQLGIDTLIVDRHERIGDNWRKRYHSLTLHNEVHVNHMPYMPFPPTWPVYIPKDMLANWFEAYVDALELNFWTGTAFTGGSYDEPRQQWNVTLRLPDGSSRVMHPRHLIFATGVSSIPYTPDLPGLADFAGAKVHSGAFKNAEEWRGRKALVLGTGTSGHDVAQELQAHGADVTIIQRSRTYVVSLKEAQSVYAIYSEGIPFDDCDLLATSFPYPVLQRSYQLSTARGREVDKALLEALEKSGFRLHYGEDETGFQMMYLRRGGGYYFNVGCSELIISGAGQAAAICRHRQFRRARRAAARRPCGAGRAPGAGDRLQEPAGHRARLSRRCDCRQDRSGLGLRRRRRVAQYVAADGAAGIMVHRRKPGAMPHLLALSGAADQGAGRRAAELAAEAE